jgi:hypothetical protein
VEHLLFADETGSKMTTPSKLAGCIEACNACVVACNQCLVACLQERNLQLMARCVGLAVECAAACQFAAAALARNGEFVGLTCLLCADICDTCAKECGRHEVDPCQACANACRRCADECRDIEL